MKTKKELEEAHADIIAEGENWDGKTTVLTLIIIGTILFCVIFTAFFYFATR